VTQILLTALGLFLAANPDVRLHGKPRPLPRNAATQDWVSFLGPSHNGISGETKLLHDWPKEGPPLLWEMSKGTGYSSPAISGAYLVFMHRVGNLERVENLNPQTGDRNWLFTYPTKFEDRYGYNNGPRASPVIDGDRVYTYGAESKLHCLNLKSGAVIWKRDIAAEFKVPQDFFGTANTPLVEGNLLIVNVGAPGGPTVAAFDKLTGKTVWGAGKDWGPSYASPVPATVHGKRRIFVLAGGESRPPTGGLLCIDPANGAVDFSYPWRSKSYESVNASSPVVVDNYVFISASYKTGGVLLEITPDFKPKVVWTKLDFGMHFSTPVYKDGYLYGFEGRNEPDASLVCVEFKTGKEMWRIVHEWDETFEVGGSKKTQKMSPYRGTLLLADGSFLATGEFGHLMWLDLTPKGFKELKRAWLFAGRETWNLPVLSHGLLYITQNTRDALNGVSPRLLCYDLRGN
jgi:outer membrane protein assembly factor BamB